MSHRLSKRDLQKIDDELKAEDLLDVKFEVEEEDVVGAQGGHCVLCQECGKGFNCQRDLEKHIKTDHDKRRYVCTDCGIEVEGLRKYNHHKSHHDVSICPHCAKQVKKNGLARHLKLCGGTGQAKHQCDQCGYQTPRFIGL